LESHPDHTESDYYDFAKTDRYVPWRDELMSSLETSRVRSLTEQGLSSNIDWVDFHKLGLRARDLFVDREALRQYDGLTDRFSDSELAEYNPTGAYKFDPESMTAFRILVDEAKASAQRNATELATDLATAMTLAGEEVGRTTTGSRSDWENSLVHDSLEALKIALKDWNSLLAESALPSEGALRERAEEVNDKLYRCRTAHEELMRSGGEEAVPFVKYQLLATMRAIGEKVAAQYLARAGKASFSALYELIRDVPNRGPVEQAAGRAYELAHKYQGDPAEAWARELTTLEHNLKQVDQNIALELRGELGKPKAAVGDALAFWRDNFTKVEPLKHNREELRKRVAQAAFGLRQYKGIVDVVFAKHDLADGSSQAKKLKGMRDRYQQTFDAFAQMLSQDIVRCVQTLQ
jgi:hypothetical protein